MDRKELVERFNRWSPEKPRDEHYWQEAAINWERKANALGAELDRLRADNARLRAALQDVVKWYEHCGDLDVPAFVRHARRAIAYEQNAGEAK